MFLNCKLPSHQSIVYVSTAYANCNLLDIEEKVYPLSKPAQTLIDEILARDSDRTPAVGDPELMGRPNSYTMSKAIAENLVREKYAAHLPVVICRPSIVTHSFKEPTEGRGIGMICLANIFQIFYLFTFHASGWCDSMNGLAGTLLLGGLGIARTMESKFGSCCSK